MAFRRAFKLLVVAMVLWALRHTLSDAWSQLGEYPWRIQPGWLLVSPGGIGVREASLVALMIPNLRQLGPHPELAAWASAALLRLVWPGAEVVISAILYPIGATPFRRTQKRSQH